MRRVLLSTDFSQNAQHAIDYALLLFGEDQMQYYLLNSYGMVNQTPETLISLDDILHEQSEKALQRSRKQIEDDHHSLEIETISTYGEAPVVIKKVVKDRNIDIVVLGSRGNKALDEVIFGSTTTHLVRRMVKPMLIVPLRYPQKPPAKIVFATDLSQVEDLTMLEPMLQLSRKYQAEIIIMNVAAKEEHPKAKDALQRLDFNNHFDGINYRFEVAEHENILEGISEFIAKERADLLVLTPKQYPTLKGLFHSSVTRKMIRRSEIPILVV